LPEINARFSEQENGFDFFTKPISVGVLDQALLKAFPPDRI
jgi:hypothetical protein